MPRKSARGAQGAGTIRKKTVTRNGKPYTYWEGRVTTGHDPGTGKQVQRSFTGKTQKEVREKMQAAAVELTAGTYTEPSKMTLGQWLDIWLEDYCKDKKYQTAKHYRAQVKEHIKPTLGAVKLSQLSPHIIQRFYNRLLEAGKTVSKKDPAGKVIRKDGKIVTEQVPLSPKSVHNVHHVLHKALAVAVDIGHLKSNPADRVTLPKLERPEIHPLSDDLVKAFFQAIAGDEYENILKVILFTGMRESEAVGLTWDAIDFNTGTINISRQLEKRTIADGGPVLSSPKSHKARIIKPAQFVLDILTRQQAEQAAQKQRAGAAWEGWKTAAEQKTAFVFTNAIGAHLQQKTVYMHFKKTAAKIGTPDSRVHDLRHTFAVLSLQNGDDVKTVQGNLGHATAAFTLDVYGHVSERMKEASAARMDAYIKGI